MNLKRIHHVAYRCKDAKETVEFYQRVLNMEFTVAYAIGRWTPPHKGHIKFFKWLLKNHYHSFVVVVEKKPILVDLLNYNLPLYIISFFIVVNNCILSLLLLFPIVLYYL